MISNAERLSGTRWPSVCRLWKNVYSYLLLILKSDCLGFVFSLEQFKFFVFWILAPYHMYDLELFSPI